jgi:hypothetical protein
MPGRSKYGAIATTVDGIRFASKAEARRYAELKLLEKAGKISRLRLQQRFELIAPKTNLRGNVSDMERVIVIGHYVADFCYDALSVQATQFVVEDVKGMLTPMYRWKKKHFEAQYGLSISEIGRRGRSPRRKGHKRSTRATASSGETGREA